MGKSEATRTILKTGTGSCIMADSWSQGLSFWYLTLYPIALHHSEPLTVYQHRVRHPMNGPAFLVLVLAAIEREIGVYPHVLGDCMDSSGNLFVMEYEDFCEKAVRFMEDRGMLEILDPEVDHVPGF